MTDELEALGRRAVACKHFRWMTGMVTGAGDVVVSADEHWTVLANRNDNDGVRWVIAGDEADNDIELDVEQPGTLGCLLALVRKAWGEDGKRMFVNVEATAGGVEVTLFEEFNDPTVWDVRMLSHVFNADVVIARASALVVALEAAP